MPDDHRTTPPPSVRNLWLGAQISHEYPASPDDLLRALRSNRAGDDEAVASALAEASLGEVASLIADRVLTGARAHAIISSHSVAGRLRRRDLLEWSEMFA